MGRHDASLRLLAPVGFGLDRATRPGTPVTRWEWYLVAALLLAWSIYAGTYAAGLHDGVPWFLRADAP